MANALKQPVVSAGPTTTERPPGRTCLTSIEEAAAVDDWLAWQCKLLSGVIRACLYSVDTNLTPPAIASVVAGWPDQRRSLSDLIPLANAALVQNRPLVKTLESSATRQQSIDCFSLPLGPEKPGYVLVLIMVSRKPAEREAVQQLVRWGSHWLSGVPVSKSTDTHDQVSISRTIADRVNEKLTLRAAAMELVGSMASQLGCERVSIGFQDRPGSRAGFPVYAISGLSEFDPRMQLAGRIASAMEESYEQNAIVHSHAEGVSTIVRAHAELAAEHGGACVSIPLSVSGKPFGVMTLEKTDAEPWPDETITWCSRIATLVAPVLYLQRQEIRSIFSRLTDYWVNMFRKFIAPEQLRLQMGLAALSFCLLLSLLIHGDHRVTATATIEGADKQVVVAPHAGFVLSVSARAGEMVEAGQVIASLDDNALLVEKDKWISELNKLDRSYTQALAKRDRTELSLLQARRAELDAELALVEQRLQRAQLVAPFNGVIVSGDLHQSLGAPVSAGEVLFEIASMEKFRLVLDVDEHEIADINTGQTGAVRLSAMPGESLVLSLTDIQPVAVVSDGANVFRLEAELSEGHDKLRPGMRGVAKINVGERPLLWLWTSSLVNRVRVWLWTIGA